MIVIGVMSGSSLDGIDLACVEFSINHSQLKWTLAAASTIDLPIALRQRLVDITNCKALELAQLESEYSAFVAQAINDFIEQNPIKPEIAGIHGHTVLHLPEYKTSWQLLNGGLVAELTELTTICDFRNQDMALGGQGTPMAVLVDKDLFPGYDAYINLGGIANISINKPDGWKAHDICGCNQLLNYFSQKAGLPYDADGKLAKSGQVIREVLQVLNADEYLRKSSPKSLDNSYLRDVIIKSIDTHEHSNADILRTIVEFLVDQIAKVIISNGASSVFMTGGGSKNSFLISQLEAKLDAQARVVIPEENIIDYKESILIAYAAAKRVLQQTNFVSEATGSERDTIGGAQYIPSKKRYA